jgi:peptide-methionine (S)-S-oxide reductase
VEGYPAGTIVEPQQPLTGRHWVNQSRFLPPFEADSDWLLVGMGCFWGAERVYWQLPGVVTTAVGYAGGARPHPSYQQVCSGATGHAEVVLVVYRPAQLSLRELLSPFWERHDPTQGMRQGNDIGSQYRSVIGCRTAAQLTAAVALADEMQGQLTQLGYGAITTEIGMAAPFYYAEEYHQQYLAKNPSGYCGLRGTGLSC